MKLIKQQQLRDILAQRRIIADLRHDLAQAQEQLDKDEALIIYAVTTGAQTEPGALSAGITETPGRRSPKWKEAFASYAGPAAVDVVISETEPGPTQRKLTVMDRGVAVREEAR